MKALGLIIAVFFCLLSLHGEEYGMAMLTYDDWLSSEETEPFQMQAFQSNPEWMEQEWEMMLFAASASASDDYTELGGLERAVPIGDGTFILLLLLLGYWVKCYKSEPRF